MNEFIYTTEYYKEDGKKYSGEIKAISWSIAQLIADNRDPKEKVIGVVAEQYEVDDEGNRILIFKDNRIEDKYFEKQFLNKDIISMN